MNVKVFLVDDHPMLLNGLHQALAQQSNLTVVGEASTAALAMKRAAELTPDLIIMDLHLPDMSGIDAIRQILCVLPFVKILVFSGDAARTLVDEALRAGACGYVWKLSPVGELIRAVQMVIEGKLYLSPEVSASILDDYRKSLVAEAEPPKPQLSELEKQLLRLVAEGRRNKEIAAQLAISAKSVEAYRSRLMKKLGCSSSAELVRYAVREGLAAA